MSLIPEIQYPEKEARGTRHTTTLWILDAVLELTNNGAEIMRMQIGQLLFLGLCILMTIASATESSDEKEKADPEKVEYAKGSVCGYCEYCKVPIYMLTNGRDLISEYIHKHYIYRKARNEVVLLIFLTVLPAL